jgi:hypothetical protein
MSAKVSSALPAGWQAAHLPPMSAAQLAGAKAAVSVGVAPVPKGTPAQLASVITGVGHSAFASGMHTAFVVGAAVALAGALIALLTKPGHADEDT